MSSQCDQSWSPREETGPSTIRWLVSSLNWQWYVGISEESNRLQLPSQATLEWGNHLVVLPASAVTWITNECLRLSSSRSLKPEADGGSSRVHEERISKFQDLFYNSDRNNVHMHNQETIDKTLLMRKKREAFQIRRWPYRKCDHAFFALFFKKILPQEVVEYSNCRLGKLEKSAKVYDFVQLLQIFWKFCPWSIIFRRFFAIFALAMK